MRLCTASGFDDKAIIGKSHSQFILHSKNDKKMLCCTNFIITKKLNDLQAILGAEFLFNENRTIMLQKNEITILNKNEHFRLKMNNILEKAKICAEPFVHSKLDMTCGNCTTNPMLVPNNMIYLANINIDDLENNFSIIQ